jgi:hypothetical protein
LDPSKRKQAVVRGIKIDDTKILEVGNWQVCHGLSKCFVVENLAEVSGAIVCTVRVYACLHTTRISLHAFEMHFMLLTDIVFTL